MIEDEQKLFLIEILVNSVNVPGIRAMQDGILPASTCVSFQILNLPLITIDQEDPASTNCACLEEVQLFKKGKSCLFALPTIVLEKELHSFPITMSVYKKLPPGVLPDVMLIGSATIELNDLMNSLVSKQVFKSGNPCRSIKDTFTISTATGQQVGDATIFIRATCCGSKIVTQFQIPHNKKPYLFKGAEESPILQCKKIPSNFPLNSTKCTCYRPTKNNTAGEGLNKSCCAPVPSPPPPSPPPPPPTPTRRADAEKFPFKPCCPTLQGQECPGASAPLFSNGSKMTKGSLGGGGGERRKCGCIKNTNSFSIK